MIRSALPDWLASLGAPLDLLVIGGGATGLGVALQAALEGRRVALVDAGDFAGGTSSRSTKLLHGGVRYLAQGRLGLVREALHERAVALGLAPHLAQPLPFVVASPNRLGRLVAWLGLKAYAWLAGALSLGPTTWVHGQRAGVRYWDGQFEDARFALALARTAEAEGAQLRNHTEVTGLQPGGAGWQVQLQDRLLAHTGRIEARCVVNATGVWVDALRQRAAAAPVPDLVRPSQGVHLVVERATLPLEEAVLVPRTADGRVLFAVPWLGATVIGTTDTPRADAPREPRPTAEEIDFLLRETREAFGVQLSPAQVRSVWVGLRPLVGSDPSQPTGSLSREHLILRDQPGFFTVTGGKWTTYRRMAEEVLQQVVASGDLPRAARPATTRSHRLWGAPPEGRACTSLREPPGEHLLGTDREQLAALPGHGVALGLGLTEALVRHSARREWAVTVEDMLARRWRALFLDARLARQMAPRVAALLAEETGLDPQLQPFLELCEHYLLPEAGQGALT